MNEYLIFQLKQGRANKGLKQSDVTRLTGIKNTTLSNYENGVTEPDIDTFLCLCELYELDFVSIMEEAYGISVPGRNFDIKPSEIEVVKKYRVLDDHGKKMVDFTLQNEWERSTWQPVEGQISLIPENGYSQIWHNGKWVNWKKVEDFFPEDEPILNAAHARTDIEVTAADQQHDEDIMDDENF